MNDVYYQIDRLKTIYRVQKDIELATAMGKNKNTIGSWKKRGSVPSSVLRLASIEKNVSPDWLANGIGDNPYISEIAKIEPNGGESEIKKVEYVRIDIVKALEWDLDVSEAVVLCAINDPECLIVPSVVNPHDADNYLKISGDDLLKVCPTIENHDDAVKVLRSLVVKGLVKTYKDQNYVTYYALSERGSSWNSEIM